MLKVIYTETGQHLEHVSTSLHGWLACQQQLAIQARHHLHIDACTASLLLPADDDTMVFLNDMQRDAHCCITWAWADAEMLEIVFAGVWMSSDTADYEGAFLADMGDRTALALVQLWMRAEQVISAMSQ